MEGCSRGFGGPGRRQGLSAQLLLGQRTAFLHVDYTMTKWVRKSTRGYPLSDEGLEVATFRPQNRKSDSLNVYGTSYRPGAPLRGLTCIIVHPQKGPQGALTDKPRHTVGKEGAGAAPGPVLGTAVAPAAPDPQLAAPTCGPLYLLIFPAPPTLLSDDLVYLSQVCTHERGIGGPFGCPRFTQNRAWHTGEGDKHLSPEDAGRTKDGAAVPGDGEAGAAGPGSALPGLHQHHVQVSRYTAGSPQSTAPRLDGQFPFQAALFCQRAPGPCPRRMAAVGGGCLRRNGTAPGKPSPGVQESTQGQEQGEGKGSSGPAWLGAPGMAQGGRCQNVQKTNLPEGREPWKERGRAGEAARTVKVNAV